MGRGSRWSVLQTLSSTLKRERQPRREPSKTSGGPNAGEPLSRSFAVEPRSNVTEARMLPHRTLIVYALAAALASASVGVMFLRDTAPETSAFHWLRPSRLTGPSRELLEFLLLLPVAVTLVCVVRVVVGLTTFGTFAPALLGLAYRDIDSPLGVFVLLTILFAGWFLRQVVGRLHLLQVPRTSFMLSSVVLMLAGFVLVGERLGISPDKAVPLFPLVILTGMIERFWTLDEEQGTASTLTALVVTLAVCAGISLALRIPSLSRQVLDYPESLGVVMAAQLVLGRYTGYRLVELYRFRSLLDEEGTCFGSSGRAA